MKQIYIAFDIIHVFVFLYFVGSFNTIHASSLQETDIPSSVPTGIPSSIETIIPTSLPTLVSMEPSSSPSSIQSKFQNFNTLGSNPLKPLSTPAVTG